MQLEALECTSNAVRLQMDYYTNRLLPKLHVPHCWNVTQVQVDKFICWSAHKCDQNISNAVGMPYKSLKCSWNVFPLGIQLESIEHEENIPTTHKNGPEWLECG